ncbi:hypothetical protein L202_06745 [Cryptococcus amylolentus CBS 6039]|uniref:Uncharacterized protein n=2 Tax=Cryptococcus amylolentus TaxID=104669 RepID=A0A1E3HDA2_9TREE|nr:hypothetical protein L202_06745 [Cryptococcus amylolentus CBS 6039]ODN74328.1 hypothetical protein L202_06745 [Cryptococcus amylolentus CBS 6039]ODO01351.1 hypothetical protein I350_06170 [Cryptococcus amylolentus CBS 6273]
MSSSSWSLPSKTPGRQVYPDYCTTQAQLSNQVGSTSDPGRMGIYVCLLDDRPHLYPSLAALHKHRHVSHSIPPPAGDAVDTAAGAASAAGGDITMSEDPPTHTAADQDRESAIRVLPENVKALLSGLQDQKDHQKEEWFHWRYTDEQEARRKSFLPLA